MEESCQTNENGPVYFLDLIVENVRCFREKQTLDLSDGEGMPARWTVLLGDNGTGKTTLLRCLAGLEPFDEYSFDPSEEKEIIPKCYFFNNKKNLISINKKSYIIGTSNFYMGFFNSDRYEKFGGFKVSYGDLVGIIPLNSEYIYLPARIFKNLVVYAYGASRRMGTGALSETQSPDSSASLFSDDVSLINSEEWLLQADFAVKRADGENISYFENRFSRIKELLIRLLPDVENIRIRPITKEQKKPGIELRTPYGWVGLKNLSLGYQTLIAWMVDLANRLSERYPESENPLSEPAIVLVDEIDLHLHPRWQRTIIRHLTDIFSQTQFVVTAHSPLIVQSAQDANVVLLRREGDQVIIHNSRGIFVAFKEAEYASMIRCAVRDKFRF